MADEITPKKETPIIEPSNESTQDPEAIPEPITAQIPVSEPLAPEPEPIVIPEVKVEPAIETPPEESPVSAPLPQEIPLAPEVKSEPAIKPETIVTPIVIASSINPIRELLNKARNAIQSRKRKKLDRILNMFTNKSKITNDEVEKFLHISDATATRYLEILEKENKIKQVGKTGKGVYYSKM
ncbi:MAG: hypothetical protein KBD48_03965 [Candidatus Pacebacteria bacterium]|nr:hypothetical protein [Candidatus Paceibacterota bacterium]MBP9716310.1 hypothetical protein [Candidatus Paceibacterota bacterium]